MAKHLTAAQFDIESKLRASKLFQEIYGGTGSVVNVGADQFIIGSINSKTGLLNITKVAKFNSKSGVFDKITPVQSTLDATRPGLVWADPTSTLGNISVNIKGVSQTGSNWLNTLSGIGSSVGNLGQYLKRTPSTPPPSVRGDPNNSFANGNYTRYTLDNERKALDQLREAVLRDTSAHAGDQTVYNAAVRKFQTRFPNNNPYDSDVMDPLVDRLTQPLRSTINNNNIYIADLQRKNLELGKLTGNAAELSANKAAIEANKAKIAEYRAKTTQLESDINSGRFTTEARESLQSEFDELQARVITAERNLGVSKSNSETATTNFAKGTANYKFAEEWNAAASEFETTRGAAVNYWTRDQYDVAAGQLRSEGAIKIKYDQLGRPDAVSDRKILTRIRENNQADIGRFTTDLDDSTVQQIYRTENGLPDTYVPTENETKLTRLQELDRRVQQRQKDLLDDNSETAQNLKAQAKEFNNKIVHDYRMSMMKQALAAGGAAFGLYKTLSNMFEDHKFSITNSLGAAVSFLTLWKVMDSMHATVTNFMQNASLPFISNKAASFLTGGWGKTGVIAAITIYSILKYFNNESEEEKALKELVEDVEPTFYSPGAIFLAAGFALGGLGVNMAPNAQFTTGVPVLRTMVDARLNAASGGALKDPSKRYGTAFVVQGQNGAPTRVIFLTRTDELNANGKPMDIVNSVALADGTRFVDPEGGAYIPFFTKDARTGETIPNPEAVTAKAKQNALLSAGRKLNTRDRQNATNGAGQSNKAVTRR